MTQSLVTTAPLSLSPLIWIRPLNVKTGAVGSRNANHGSTWSFPVGVIFIVLQLWPSRIMLASLSAGVTPSIRLCQLLLPAHRPASLWLALAWQWRLAIRYAFGLSVVLGSKVHANNWFVSLAPGQARSGSSQTWPPARKWPPSLKYLYCEDMFLNWETICKLRMWGNGSTSLWSQTDRGAGFCVLRVSNWFIWVTTNRGLLVPHPKSLLPHPSNPIRG